MPLTPYAGPGVHSRYHQSSSACAPRGWLRPVQQDAQTQHQRTLEAKASLERALGGKLAEAAGEKRRLETSVEEARKEATEVQGHLEQLRSSTSQAGSPYRGSPYRATPQRR
mmetsp:Transcript_47685/g.126076  ORF Transcript_47685/g.126076 Transcript_47685/m.126076 type:complete len:112 (-) Transcript_47685:273-608(-)